MVLFMTSFPALGVCYYPEHWPEDLWIQDAARMVDAGIKRVRIGEFAWAKIEPEPGHFNWTWLDTAIEILNDHSLEIVLGTPTATPPKWLVDEIPSMLAVDPNGQPRTFGSRRHYSFSSMEYRTECNRIVSTIVKRYGTHPAIKAWQTDNEYGCHDTTRSYCENAKIRFREWLQKKYELISSLNESWGSIFWSQTYRNFSEIDLPNLTVTEANPSHILDFYRFASSEVIEFNRLQTDIIRKHSPGRDIYHNFMGFYFGFDHFKLGDDIDAATWDSYPLGFLDIAPSSEEEKSRYLRQGHPDFAAFHHDLYRRCGKGRWQVMEQQPGPVNWADHNPAPLPGMVNLWSHEAFAHEAEVVSYFRWRQAPFAQEQMHAGLLRADDHAAPGLNEAKITSDNLNALCDSSQTAQAPAALMFSYEAKWLFDIHPQGKSWNYPFLCMKWYSALRNLGINIDIVAPNDDLSGYKLVLIPSDPFLNEKTLQKINDCDAQVIFGPRSGSKTISLQIPKNLAPGSLQSLIPIKITHSESLRPNTFLHGEFNGNPIMGHQWIDHVETSLTPAIISNENIGLAYTHGRFTYLTTVPDETFLAMIVKEAAAKTKIPVIELPRDLRMRKSGNQTFVFNYGPNSISIDTLIPDKATILFGDRNLRPAHTACWRS